ncbi:hypothetical protein [Streptomyces sp. NBC_00582]|uniref:hypothetical protein n=1 Tax=Streptomyces sp. NBC_00582 TaxID=2975783 RepID=UPI002E8238EB|nr:hypothetical protein [Streptomyces sp. NBC_00582]WUB64591.1 hypothetical protein OG852_31430 [Streptomyces sp. NBC_00582]
MTSAPPRPDVVPFIAAWSGEPRLRRNVVYAARGGVAFADETPEDRDQFGVLWNSRAMAPGTGRPRYGEVHPDRQCEAMRYLLCQVCGRPADRDRRGVLWLLEDNRADWDGWPNDLLTVHPPICLPCAGKAVEMCPHLVDSNVAVRVHASEVCGVYGRVWAPSAFGYPVRTANADVVAYGTAAARWVLAGQLVRSLHGCTIVDLQRELARCR